MGTPFEKVFKIFLSQIDDYELAIPEEEELNEILCGYLDEARSLHFKQCKKDIENATVNPDFTGYFQDDLSLEEQHILALGMKKAWLSPKLNSADLMARAIGDRDFKAIQGTNYIKELSKLDSEIEQKIRDYNISYSYNNFSLEGW